MLFCAALSAQEVFKNSELTVSQLEKGVWVVETADMTTMYIVEGTNRALLIEIVWTLGHTPGAFVLLDHAINAFYKDDAFGSGQVWMQLLPHVPMRTYYESCVRKEKIMREQNITKIYCGHYPYLKRALPIDYIVDMKELAKRLSEGDTSGSTPSRMPFNTDEAPGKSVSVTLRSATIVYDSGKIN